MPDRKRSKRPPGDGGQQPPVPQPRPVPYPVFAQPEPTPDPTHFRLKHPSDTEAYLEAKELGLNAKPQKFLPPRGVPEPILILQDVFGGDQHAIRNIENSGQIVFHALGDCGSTHGPQWQNQVTDKMLSDFHDEQPQEVPQFALLLGDIVYSFGEHQYYYDQFYEPYRDYPAPVLAVAGNHDGMISPQAGAASLEAYYRNFCDDTYGKTGSFTISPDAGGLSRTAQIQPGVFFTFDAPFIRILAIYSNVLEDPGVIAEGEFAAPGTIGNSQLVFLETALKRIKDEKYPGAVVIADHHPPYTGVGSRHGWSEEMLEQIDTICSKVGVWPHAFLSGHAHNYQRFTRTRPDKTEIPYVVCGNGGHNAQALIKKGNPAPRTPQVLQKTGGGKDQVVFENYDAAQDHYGYLRVLVTKDQLRVEYHPAGDGRDAKTPDDSVTVDIKTRTLTHYAALDLGAPEAARATRARATDTRRRKASWIDHVVSRRR